MARVTITNKRNHSYLVPSPVRSVVGPQKTKVFDGISIPDMEASASFVRAIDDGIISIVVTADPGIPPEVEVGNQLADSHLNTLRMPEERDIYVDGVSGSPEGKGTVLEPFMTIEQAYDVIPSVVTNTVRIHLGPHSGTGYALPPLSKTLRDNLWIIGTEKTELLAITAAVSGTTTGVTTAGGMTVDAYRGKTIEILTGISAGDRRTVQTNSATSITVSKIWSGSGIDVGDTFRVFEPAVIIETTEDYQSFGEDFGPVRNQFGSLPVSTLGLFFENIIFDIVKYIEGKEGSIYMYGCELKDTFNILQGRMCLSTGNSRTEADPATPPEMSDRGALNAESWEGWGLYGLGRLYVSSFIGHWVADGAIVFTTGVHRILGGSFRNDNGNVLTALGTTEGPCTVHTRPLDTNLRIEGDASTGLVANGKGAQLYASATQISLTGTSVGVSTSKGGYVHLGSVSISATTGIAAKESGTVHFTNSTSHNASGNDIEIGNVPTVHADATTLAIGDAVVGVPFTGEIVQRTEL